MVNQRRQGEPLAGAGDEQRAEGEDIADIRPGVVGPGVEADGQEESEGQDHAAQGGQPSEHAGQDAQPDGKFPQGDEHAQESAHTGQMMQQSVDRAGSLGRSDLGLDGDGAGRAEEVGVGQLLQPGEAECHAEEQP